MDIPENVDTTDVLYARFPLRKGTNEIRLIDFASSDAQENDPLSGNMRVVSLDQKPNFAALSYVWGDSSSKPERVKLGTSILSVGGNCVSALKRLLEQFQTLTIWVDALCINQADEDEKLWQLPLMGQIYTIAAPTYIWLGEGSNLSDQGMKYLATAGFQIEYSRYADDKGLVSRRMIASLAWKSFRNTWLVMLGAMLPDQYVPSKGALASISSISPRPVWDQKISGASLHDVLSRPWINRIWTFQELLLSPNPILCCGTQFVHWKSMYVSILFLKRFRWLFARGSPSPLLTSWTGIALLWNFVNNGLDMTPGQGTMHPSRRNQSHSSLDISLEYSHFVDIVYQTYILICLCFCSLVVLPLGAAVGCGFGFKYTFTHLKAKPYLILLALLLLLIFILATNCCLAAAAMIWNRKTYRELQSTVEQLMVFVNEVHVRQTSDARDKSYGIHSILQKMNLTMQRPDSTRSREDIHGELSKCFLQWTGSLDFLICRGNGQNTGSHSWMPDWNQISKRGSLNESYVLGTHVPRRWETIQKPIGHAENEPPFTLRKNNELVVRGKHLMQISTCFDSFLTTSTHYKDDERPTHLHNIHVLHKVVHHIKSRTQLRAWSDPMLLWRHRSQLTSLKIQEVVPMADTSQVRPVLYRIQSSLLNNIHNPRVANEVFDAFRRDLNYFAWWRFPPRRIDEFNHCIQWFNQRAEDSCAFALASDDDRLTYGPQHAETGDTIAFIWGISLPVVLRKVADHHYRLIGFARVEGVDMNTLAGENNFADLQEIVIL